jgi:hypothetical protein
MKSVTVILVSSLLGTFGFVAGWVLGRADLAMEHGVFSAISSMSLARSLEEKGTKVPDRVFSQIDGAVSEIDSAYSLLMYPEAKKQAHETLLMVANFRDAHPNWVQYYNGSTWPMERDDRLVKRLDAILLKARQRHPPR